MTIDRAVVWIFVVACLGHVEAQDVPANHFLGPTNQARVDAEVLRGTEERKQGPQHDIPWNAVPMVTGLEDSSNINDNTIQLVVGQGRIVTTKAPVVQQGGVGVIAVGDPTVADFEVLPNPRMLRLTGKRPGTTDLTVVTSDEQILVFELHVQFDLTLLQARLRQSFRDASVNISQMGEHLIIEGQARDQRQLLIIEKTVQAFLQSKQNSGFGGQATSSPAGEEIAPEGLNNGTDQAPTVTNRVLRALPEVTQRPQSTSTATPQIINLMTVPGVQQVLLQVRIAELDRTGLREIGGDMFFQWDPGNVLGTQISGAASSLNGLGLGPKSTAFGIFPTARAEIILRALRDNSLVRVLAEPNLVALSGHEASFLAGGEFPVPVPQGGTGGGGNVTVSFKQFGVQLNFVPHILDDDVIHLEVRPEVSTIDQSLGTTLVVGGSPVPGINTRRVHTTVQLREGESLALAGLLQVTLDANTTRLPGLGDLPYLGPLFSNTSHKRVEKELLVIVTPHLVSPLNSHCMPPLPGEEIQDPNDLEFYLLSRIEGRTGQEFRSTIAWDDPWHLARLMRLDKAQVCGPVGFSPHPSQARVMDQKLPAPPLPPATE